MGEPQTYVAMLEQAVRQLALAVQTHRMDLHLADDRPCGTCDWSAKVLRSVNVEPFVEGGRLGHVEAHDSATKAHVTEPDAAIVTDPEVPS